MSGKNVFVGLLGLTGSGKSTLAAILTRMGFLHLEEPFAANPFLQGFYDSGMKEKAFQSQMFFLLRKWALTMAARPLLQYFPVSIDPAMDLDIRMYVQALREMGSLSEAEYALYHQAVEALSVNLSLPDLLIYCHVEPETALVRIGSRRRKMEGKITKQYLTLQKTCLEKWLQGLRSSVLWLDFEGINATSEKGALAIMARVEEALKLV